MASPDAHEPLSASIYAVIFDCILTIAIAAAYFPQLRRLRKFTTGDSPSVDGLSPYYIFSHAIFCSSQLSYIFLIIWDYDSGRYTRFGAFGWSLGVVQVFVQWLCAVSMVAIYVLGRSEKVQSKLCSPALILIHASFLAFMALIVVQEGLLGSRHSLGAAFPWLTVNGLHYIISPLALFTQLVAQSRELKKKKERDGDPGALSLRSFALQAAVMFVLAVRLIVKFGWGSFGGEPDEPDKFARWQLVLIYAFEFWQLDHVSWNYLVWVVGVVVVWYKMLYRKDFNGRDEDGERASLLE